MIPLTLNIDVGLRLPRRELPGAEHRCGQKRLLWPQVGQKASGLEADTPRGSAAVPVLNAASDGRTFQF